MVQCKINLEPPPITLIEIKNNAKLDKYFVDIKLCRYPTTEKSDFDEFKMALFDNDDPEEFLLFIQNFQITLQVSGMIAASMNIQYLHTLLCGKTLRQLDMLFVEVGITTISRLNHIILVLGMYFPPCNELSKQKCAMCHGMRKPRELKVRCYAACMINLNEYFSVFLGAKANEKLVIHNLMRYTRTVCQMGRSRNRTFRGFIVNILVL